MFLSDALKDKIMDIRLRDKLLAEGKITAKDVELYLTSLEEDEKRLSYTELETESTESVDSTEPIINP